MNYYCPRIPRISNDRYTGAADVAIYVKKHVYAPRLEDTIIHSPRGARLLETPPENEGTE